MAFANLPHEIAAFLDAVNRRDFRAILATFADGAVLVDECVEHHGQAIGEWIEYNVLQRNATLHPINAARRTGTTIITVMARPWDKARDGRAAAQLDCRFMVSAGKIDALTIEMSKLPNLPAPVDSYVFAANTFDLEALSDAFADDAVVNDQLQEHRGNKAIRKWAASDIIADRVTMYVVGTVQHYGHAIVTANVDGDYDKRGLPDPLVLTFYFSIYGEKIVQLIILRNEPDV